MIPLNERHWLLPRFRERTVEPKKEPAPGIAKLMSEPPHCKAESDAHREELAA